MATTPFSGTEGKITSNGANVHVTEWSATAEADYLNTGDSGSGGFETGIPGWKRLTATGKGWYDSSNPPFASPPNLNPGASVTFALFLKNASGGQITGTGLVVSIQVTSTVNAVVFFDFQIKSTGTFTLPSGTF